MMNKSSQHRRQWRIGELAAAAGVTVRALHHYEQAGLLKAPERTEGGHRVYDATGVERLYQILAFRRLGLSLEEIGQMIDGGRRSTPCCGRSSPASKRRWTA